MSKIQYFIAQANEEISKRLPSARICYPMATTNPDEPEGLWTNITPDTEYIAVGYKQISWFKDWDTAIDYAKTLTDKNYIGIREEECDIARFTPIAVINEDRL